MASAIQHIHGLAVNNAAVGIVDGNFLTLLLFLRLHVKHVGQCKLLNIVVFVQLQALLNLILYLLWEHNLVHQFCLHVVLAGSKCQQTVVNQLVQRLSLNLSTCSHLLQPVVPDTVQVSLTLFAVILTHACLGVALYIALIFSNLGHHVLHAKLVIQSLIILSLAAKTAQVNGSLTIQINLIGNSSHIVAGLTVVAGIAHNPLSALLEVLQSIAQLLCGSRAVESGATAFDVYTLDVLFVLSLMDAGNQIIQSHRARIAHSKQVVEWRSGS